MSSDKEEEVAITLKGKPPTKKKKQSSLTHFLSGITIVVKEAKNLIM